MKIIRLPLLFIFFLYLISGTIEAQGYLFAPQATVNKGDSVVLNLNAYQGDIQWQKSIDTIYWEDIVMANCDSLLIIADTTSYYRAVVVAGNCDPFYSENIMVSVYNQNIKTVIVDTALHQLLSDSSNISNNKLSFLGGTESDFSVNDILLGTEGDGYLKIVKGISSSGDTIKIQTEQASIAQVLQNASINDSILLTINTNKKAVWAGHEIPMEVMYLPQGAKLKSSGSGLDLTGVVLFNNTVSYINEENESVVGSLKVYVKEGIIDFEPMVKRKLEFANFQLTNLELVAGGDIEFDMTLGIECDVKLSKTFKTDLLESLKVAKFKYGPIFIGPVPTFIEFGFEVGFVVSLGATEIAEIAMTSNYSTQFGACYNQQSTPQWKPVWETESNFNVVDPVWSKANYIEAKVFVSPNISLKAVGLTGPYFAVEPYLRGSAGIEYPDWFVSLYGGIDGKLGFKAEVFDFDIVDYYTTLVNWEKEIYHNGGGIGFNLPVVSTAAEVDVNSVTAIVGGEVINSGGNEVIARGVCWNTSGSPTKDDNYTFDGTGTGQFNSTVSKLLTNTTYYLRAYATNMAGTVYGEEISFKTEELCVDCETGFVEDIDGNVYNTVKIGEQWWMAENLYTTHYSDGTGISHVEDNNEWIALKSPGYCWYNNDEFNFKDKYGALYNWYAVNTEKLCPAGWHVPTDTEWKQLEIFLGMSAIDADKELWYRGTDEADKLRSDVGWNSNCLHYNNQYGFTALPGGARINQGFIDADIRGYWLSSSSNGIDTAWNRIIVCPGHTIDRRITMANSGKSVRCVKDDAANSAIPQVRTSYVSNISTSEAISGGNNLKEGSANIYSKGICWNTSGNPTTEDHFVESGYGLSNYTVIIPDLLPNTVYYIRAYASNRYGTGYGSEVSCKTLNPDYVIETGSLSDIDGNSYHSVKVGNQWWMAENLAVSKYNDGAEIPLVEAASAWYGLGSPAYCWYDNDEAGNKETYGALYNGHVINTNKLCPSGWHLPSDAEWQELEIFLGMHPDVANIYWGRGGYESTLLKSSDGWLDNGNGTNYTGFTGLPAGIRKPNYGNPIFSGIGSYTAWWTATLNGEDYYRSRSMGSTTKTIGRGDYSISNGLSVRCIKD